MEIEQLLSLLLPERPPHKWSESPKSMEFWEDGYADGWNTFRLLMLANIQALKTAPTDSLLINEQISTPAEAVSDLVKRRNTEGAAWKLYDAECMENERLRKQLAEEVKVSEGWRSLEPFLGKDLPNEEVVRLRDVKAMLAATPQLTEKEGGE